MSLRLTLSFLLCAAALLGCDDEAVSEALLDTAVDATSDVAIAKDLVQKDAGDDTQDSVSEDPGIVPETCLDNPGGFECPCTTGSECDSNFCVQGFEGQVCTKECLDDCPEDWRCVVFLSTCPDCAALCVPEIERNCAPCETDFDCQGGQCLTLSGGERACGDPCGEGHPCGDGFSCEPSDVPSDKTLEICKPTNGTCDCTSANVKETRACTAKNEAGICAGFETCDLALGWTGCTARTPAPESCNGIDDDCNGPADDGVLVVGTPCENDVPGVGTCEGTFSCEGEAGLVCSAATPLAETCNGADDDCDGTTDEDCGTPPLDGLCKPCTEDGDCSVGTTCAPVGTGAFCSVNCTLDGQVECPTGFACTASLLGIGPFCLLPSGGCGTSGSACSSNTDCEDLDACTEDVCTVGGCTFSPVGCNDSNACTTDSCDSEGGCSNVPSDDGCDDGDACTTGDVCSPAGCAGVQKDCNDQLSCTLDSCSAGTCVQTVVAGTCLIAGACHVEGAAEPGNPCRVCDPDVSPISFVAATAGTPCTDDDKCTQVDLCQNGACAGTSPIDCDDFNGCTTEQCDPATGCTVENNQNPCQDGLYCTIDDVCTGGDCLGAPRDCTYLDGGCAKGICDEGTGTCAKTGAGDGVGCNDGQACTGGDVCSGQACQGLPIPACCTLNSDCDDNNPCTADTCAPGSGLCSNNPVPQNGVGCEDGLYCTTADVCGAGECHGAQRDCSAASDSCNTGVCDEQQDACNGSPKPSGALCPDDGNLCTADTCQAGSCGHPPNAAACDDGDLCSTGDTCAGGACAGTLYSCDDALPCTLDVCLGDGSCGHKGIEETCLVGATCYADGEAAAGDPCLVCNAALDGSAFSPAVTGTTCSDGDDCTGADACALGVCEGVAMPCDDGNACTADSCANGVCVFDSGALSGATCTDALYCTVNETCSSGVCGGAPRDCDGAATGECTVGSCDEDTDACVPAPAVDGLACTSDDNLCTDDVCATGLCAHPTNALGCDDGDPCTASDVCGAGSCTGAPFACDDGLACTTDECDGAGGCLATLTSGQCAIEGACFSSGAGNPTNVCQVCDAGAPTGWSARPNGTVCDDGASCTAADACAAGVCTGSGTKDTDADGFVDVACGGTDCDDGAFGVKPGVPDAIDGVFVAQEIVDPGGVPGHFMAARLDTAGKVHAAWFNPTTQDLEYGTDRDGFWTVASIDRANKVGDWASIALDSLGGVHVAYRDATNTDLRYATNASGVWVAETVSTDTLNDVGTHTTLAVVGGAVHVLYYDATATSLVHRIRTAGAWSAPVTVDGLSGSAGMWSSVVASSAGVLHAAWYDATNLDLRYGSWTNGAWTTTTVDGTGLDAGSLTSIALGPDGAPHILYRDLTGFDQRHAKRSAAGTWETGIVYAGSSGARPASHGWPFAVLDSGAIVGCGATSNSILSAYTPFRFTNATSTLGEPEDYLVESFGATTSQVWCAAALSTDGKAHIVWTHRPTSDVNHTTNVGALTGWEQVDGDDSVGEYASLARDAAGGLHAAYYDATSTAVRYARKLAGGVWESEIVNNSAAVGTYSTIAVEAGGTVHIAWYDSTKDDLQYVRGTLGAFGAVETVDEAGNVGEFGSLVLGPGGSPYIAYKDTTNTALKLAVRSDSGWTAQTVDNAASVGDYAALAVTAAGTVHMAYYDASSTALRYIRGKPGLWEPPQVVDSVGTVGRDNAIVLDGSGNVHISTTSGANVLHIQNTAGGSSGFWASEVVGAGGGTTSIRIDKNGTPLIAYGGTSVQLARKIGPTWVVTTVDPENTVFASLVLGPDNDWYIAYYAATGTALRLASNTLKGWSVPETIVYNGTVGLDTSIAVDATGAPHVAYYDSANTSLKYARRVEGVWHRADVDMTNNVGTYPDIEVGADRTVHIAYHDVTLGDLRYARIKGGQIVSEAIATSGVSGLDSSLALGPDGTVHIAHYDSTGDDLEIARGNFGGWAIQTLDAVNDTGNETSVAVDPAGGVHVAYRYASGKDLRYIKNTGPGFSASENVEIANDVGNYVSLDVDALGYAYIAHCDETTDDLRYTTNKTGVWAPAIVDGAGISGTYASLDVHGPGVVVIGYRDDSQDDARLAVNTGNLWQLFTIDAIGGAGQFLSIRHGAGHTVWMSHRDTTTSEIRVAQISVTNTDQNCDGY